METINPKIVQRLQEINELALELHGATDESNAYTLKSMKEHAQEISELFPDNEHWKAETADMLIHCLLLLERNETDVAEMNKLIEKRYERFKVKISANL